MLRRQLPVFSPLSVGALLHGLAATVHPEPYEKALTERLIREFGADGVLLTDSGTTALALALSAGREGRKDPVALPAYCCFDVATAADAAGVPVLLYDLNPHTLSPDLDSLQRALERGARVVVVAHLYGMPVDWTAVEALARGYDAQLIEDAAQGQGASYRGRRLGALGTISVLSFGRGKGVTGGRGGALLWRGRGPPDGVQLGPPPWSIPVAVKTAVQWVFARPSLYGIPSALPFLHLGETLYRPVSAARRLPRFAAGALSVTWSLAEREAEQRRARADRLVSDLASVSGLETVRAVDGAEPGFLRLPVVATPELGECLGSPLARRTGVMPAYPQALNELTGFAPRVQNTSDSFPGSHALVRRLWTLPTHGQLNEEDAAALIELARPP